MAVQDNNANGSSSLILMMVGDLKKNKNKSSFCLKINQNDENFSRPLQGTINVVCSKMDKGAQVNLQGNLIPACSKGIPLSLI